MEISKETCVGYLYVKVFDIYDMNAIFSIHVTNDRLRNTSFHNDVILSKNIYPPKYQELGSQTVLVKMIFIKEKTFSIE